MAVSGSGTKPMGATVDPAMVDQTKYDARKGAAKKTQTNYPVHPNMKDQQSFKNAGPSNPGTGPDASSPNVMDPEPRVKYLLKQSQILNTPWGGAAPWSKNGDGNGLDGNAAGKVLGEAILSGSDKLPAFVKAETDSGAAPKPWPTPDSGG